MGLKVASEDHWPPRWSIPEEEQLGAPRIVGGMPLERSKHGVAEAEPCGLAVRKGGTRVSMNKPPFAERKHSTGTLSITSGCKRVLAKQRSLNTVNHSMWFAH